MDIIRDKDFFSDSDFIQVKGLTRASWNLFWHPNAEFLKTLEFSGIQVYLLDGTIYGCFVNKNGDAKIETQWFGHHLSSFKNNEGKIVPSSVVEVSQLLELCDPEKLDGIIFNLDLLR
jgi:hypothetical protein